MVLSEVEAGNPWVPGLSMVDMDFFVDEAIQEISYVREEVPGKDWSS